LPGEPSFQRFAQGSTLGLKCDETRSLVGQRALFCVEIRPERRQFVIAAGDQSLLVRQLTFQVADLRPQIAVDVGDRGRALLQCLLLLRQQISQFRKLGFKADTRLFKLMLGSLLQFARGCLQFENLLL
jgi:hypothetical protein